MGEIEQPPNTSVYRSIKITNESITPTSLPKNRNIDPKAPSVLDRENPASKTCLPRNILNGDGACQLGDLRVSLVTDGTERKS